MDSYSKPPLARPAQAGKGFASGSRHGDAASTGQGLAYTITRFRSAAATARNVALVGDAGRLGRYAVHVTVLALAVIAVGASAAPRVDALSASILSASIAEPLPQPPFELFATRGFFASNGNAVSRLADWHTSIPYRTRRDIAVYVVQPGDTVQGIASAYGLNPETIMWANPAVEDLPDLLRIGQEIVILPIDGVYHEVKEGDSLQAIAAQYKVDVDAITGTANEWNKLQPPDYAITPGAKLIVAGGVKPYVPKLVTAYDGPIPSGARGTGRFQWPVVGRITQDYWYGHRAVDIAAPTGTPVYAADGGFVSFVGWTNVGYGYLIRIDHGNGFASWYAHLSGYDVVLGQAVRRGDRIGAVGSTGNSSGPHLHLEIRTAEGLINPRFYLP